MNKKALIISFSILFTTQAMAYSSLQCTSNHGITYSNNNLVGGVRPFPGMVTNVEEIKTGGIVAYRKVARESCDGRPECVLQQPELTDILPPNFTFSFYPETKSVLSTSGTMNGPIFSETYAEQFRINKMMNVWMLCDYTQELVP
jgi:hypothetical protein